jgi:hypothetical protein
MIMESSITDLVKLFGDLAGIVAIIVFVTQFLKDKVFDELKGTGAQILSWVIGIAASFIGTFLNIGMFEVVHGQLATLWYVPIVIGFFSGLVSNGVFDLSLARKIVKAIFKIVGIKVLPEMDK